MLYVKCYAMLCSILHVLHEQGSGVWYKYPMFYTFLGKVAEFSEVTNSVFFFLCFFLGGGGAFWEEIPPKIITNFVCFLDVIHIFSPHKSNSPPNYNF